MTRVNHSRSADSKLASKQPGVALDDTRSNGVAQ